MEIRHDAAPGPTRLPRALRPFRHREYRLLASSMLFSLFATGIWLVAIVWQVIELGGGPSQLSLVAAAGSAGLLLSVLAGGVAADRLPRRRVLGAVETVRIASAAVAATLALTGTLALWHLAVVAFLLGTADAFYYPSASAILPSLLPADELLAANGVEGTLRPVAVQAAGPAVAGLVVGALFPAAGLLAATIGFCLALPPLLAMRRTPAIDRTPPGDPVGTDGRPSVLADVREGFAYLLRTGWLFATLAFSSLYVLVVIGPIEVLLPFAVRDQTGGGPSEYALVLGAFGIGSAVGSIATSSIRLPRRYLTVMILAWGIGGVPLAFIGLTNLLLVMVVIAFAVGVTSAGAMVIWGTLLQRRVPPHLLGRVSSLDFFVSLALMPVSMALAGPIGEWVGIPLTFLLAGTVPVLLAVAAVVGWRLDRDELAHPLDTAPPAAPASEGTADEHAGDEVGAP
ncbi:MAG: MFS transporter [Pseudonocardia sp.]|uniref:MFS transporter n=1 Tax=unclassified Pseudonocardia TaxID=2619320 RepID=UPI000ABA3712|nr:MULTISPECIES: MFS transporter [unclassified Pseudonocardia]MBN9108773.1 MFS transporter [Pseudonocardia sp.]